MRNLVNDATQYLQFSVYLRNFTNDVTRTGFWCHVLFILRLRGFAFVYLRMCLVLEILYLEIIKTCVSWRCVIYIQRHSANNNIILYVVSKVFMYCKHIIFSRYVEIIFYSFLNLLGNVWFF